MSVRPNKQDTRGKSSSDGEGFFLDIAKISITIAGFAGVIAALRHPRDLRWEANEIAGLKFMLEHSLGAVLSGLLPSILYFCFADEPTVWLWSSSFLALFLMYELLMNIARVRHATGFGSPPRKFGLLLSTFFAPTAVVLFFQVQNVLYWRGPATFAIGAVWLIFAACTQFMPFVSEPEKENGIGLQAAYPIFISLFR